MVCLIAGIVIAAQAGLLESLQVPDSMALGVALAHARTVITEGDIQVSPVSAEFGNVEPVPGSWMPEYSLLERAARVAGLSYGPDRVAVTCVPNTIACRSQGTFRGVVNVAGIKFPSPDSVIITLRILHFTPRPEINYARDDIYEQVDDVHVARKERGSAWHIVRVQRISET